MLVMKIMPNTVAKLRPVRGLACVELTPGLNGLNTMCLAFPTAGQAEAFKELIDNPPPSKILAEVRGRTIEHEPLGAQQALPKA